jgi:hypothetical protein
MKENSLFHYLHPLCVKRQTFKLIVKFAHASLEAESSLTPAGTTQTALRAQSGSRSLYESYKVVVKWRVLKTAVINIRIRIQHDLFRLAAGLLASKLVSNGSVSLVYAKSNSFVEYYTLISYYPVGRDLPPEYGSTHRLNVGNERSSLLSSVESSLSTGSSLCQRKKTGTI